MRVAWTGFNGAPGVSTFYGLTAGTSLEALHTFFDSIKGVLPEAVHLQIAGEGEFIEDSTGEVTDLWVDDEPAAIVGGGYGSYAGPVGCAVRWTTDTVVDGARLKGHTFLVPLYGNSYDGSGTLSESVLTTVGTAAAALVAANAGGDLVVWHRPRVARAADGSRPAVAARAGSHGLITGSSVPDKAAVLRSRRD